MRSNRNIAGAVVVCLTALCLVFAALLWIQSRAASRQTSISLGGQPAEVGQPKQNSTDGAVASDPLCIAGCPTGVSPKDRIVKHHILILANNPDTKFADWVAYRILPETLGSHCKRKWSSDPDIDPQDTLAPRDYIGIRSALHSDRGHQAPLASLCGALYWMEADYLSNITPQKSDLNEGAWERLENAERRLVSSGRVGVVYSFTGPLYERAMPALPEAHLAAIVPSGYWKVIAIEKGGKVEAAAFIMDQSLPRDADYCSERVSISEVEKRTRLNLFPSLPSAPLPSDDFSSALGCQ
jgi:endonuclease G, mitochondrial